MAAYFYMLANETNEVLYKGSTTDLIRRMYEHKEHLLKGSFTDKYNVTRLIYYECYDDIQSARAREHQVGLHNINWTGVIYRHEKRRIMPW